MADYDRKTRPDYFDPGVPTVVSPETEEVYSKDRQSYGQPKQPQWHTVIIKLYESVFDMQVVYVFAIDEGDAMVKAAAYVLELGSDEKVSWLEAYEYLVTLCYDAFVITGAVSVSQGFNFGSESMQRYFTSKLELARKKEEVAGEAKGSSDS